MAHRFLRSIHTWPVPPNWSPRDWSEELRAEVIAATWEAERDFDPARGVSLDAFVKQRVWTRSLSRYRREWAYARHCGCHLEGGDHCDVALDEALSSIEMSESLQTCLQRLPDPQRRLLEGLFWEEKTEIEVAGMLCLTQSGISRESGAFWTSYAVGWISQKKKKATPRKIEVIKRPPPCILMSSGREMRAVPYRP